MILMGDDEPDLGGQLLCEKLRPAGEEASAAAPAGAGLAVQAPPTMEEKAAAARGKEEEGENPAAAQPQVDRQPLRHRRPWSRQQRQRSGSLPENRARLSCDSARQDHLQSRPGDSHSSPNRGSRQQVSSPTRFFHQFISLTSITRLID